MIALGCCGQGGNYDRQPAKIVTRDTSLYYTAIALLSFKVNCNSVEMNINAKFSVFPI